jgi:hypothetical protein
MLIALPPAAALSAEYVIFPNGTAYRASIEITDASQYEFADVGLMGENVPVSVGEVILTGNCSPCRYNWSSPVLLSNRKEISFERGNYTVSYVAPLRDNHLQGSFEKPYYVNVAIPPEFDVQNPLLAGISMGANVTRHADNTTTVQWNRILSFDLRYYNQGQQDLLYFFLQFMGIFVLILVVIPYLISKKKDE